LEKGIVDYVDWAGGVFWVLNVEILFFYNNALIFGNTFLNKRATAQWRVKNNMHIFDGALSPAVVLVTFIIAIIFLAVSVKKVKLSDQQVPLMGLLTAVFFAAMSLNFPLIGPTTSHILGSASLGLILGPFAGAISVTIILVLQALLFGDGGLTTFGANVLNMGIIAVVVPCIVFLALNKLVKGKGNALFAAFFVSAFIGDVLAAVAAGAELGFSTSTMVGGFPYGLSVAVPAMAINHSIIGVAEGVVTMILIGVLLKVRPDVLQKSPVLKHLNVFQTKNEGV
jgi:cobalt/nickel transport system permease protein